ncbi:MAG TPA: NRDE family protein [Acidimicrobiales bacterium]|jgi:uncharacterized protein with NRDE domain|nr:NRDE family protein [Acidimicrobiales bacterium]
MCLLVFAWQTEPAYALVVAANRDERFERPAHSLCVLRERDPRILGGRDDLAGGTWLAVNQHGVVAGLTNRPAPGGRDLSKRSRGELPLMAAEQRTAHDAVHELARRVNPGDYNPAWLLVADRNSLHYVEIAADRSPSFRQLPPGIHILENVALGEPSLKIDRVRSLMSGASGQGRSLWTAMPAVLADHTVPTPGPATGEMTGEVERPPATLASCVHTDDYGTRSAVLVRVPIDPAARPEMAVADGPPCTTPFIDVSLRM